MRLVSCTNANDTGVLNMTPTILFVLIVSIAAIAFVAAAMRAACLIAGGRFEQSPSSRPSLRRN
jgi:hypothetical protein